MDRGMNSAETWAFLSRSGRRYLLATRRSERAQFQKQLQQGPWQRREGHRAIEVKMLKRQRVT